MPRAPPAAREFLLSAFETHEMASLSEALRREES